ncbi:hypothetical protein [Roseateles sp. BYS87W]|uniref:YqjK-like protein n=1 Tax=Pelomonas baiyunensis TaxID=3299026 RepID=A0ABW7GYT0_9BURK
MIPHIPDDPAARLRRKEDLLLASEVMRGQAVAAVCDLGERGDRWGRRWLWLQGWLADPAVRALLGGGAAFFATAGRSRRARLWRWARGAWVVWRLWRRAA